jgi:hypothetical protein
MSFAESIAAQSNPTFDDAAPSVNEMSVLLQTASSQLAGLPASGTSKRQSDDDIASLAAGIVTVRISLSVPCVLVRS